MKRSIPAFVLGSFFLVSHPGKAFRTKIVALQGASIQNNEDYVLGPLGGASGNIFGDVCFQSKVSVDGVTKDSILRVMGNQMEIIALQGPLSTPFREETQTVYGAQYKSFKKPAIGPLGRVAFVAFLETNAINVSTANNLVVAASGTQPGETWVLDRTNRQASITDSQDVDGSKQSRFGDLFFTPQGYLNFHSLTRRTDSEGQRFYRNSLFQVTAFHTPQYDFLRSNHILRGEEFLESDYSSATLRNVQISTDSTSDGKLRAITADDSGYHVLEVGEQGSVEFLTSGQSLPDFPRFSITKIRGLTRNPGSQPPFLVTASDGTSSVEAIIRKGPTPETPAELISMVGRPAPGSFPNAVFSGFEVPVSAENNVLAFVANEQVGPQSYQSIWRKLSEGVEPRAIARSGEQVPGFTTGVTFRSFGRPMINALGQVVFAARLNHGFGITTENDFAYFLAEQNLRIRKVVGEGDLFFFGFLKPLPVAEIEVTDLTASGEILFTLKASDEASAIIKVTIPPVELLHFDQWAEEQFPSPSDRLRLADPDQDGISNFLEYAYGTDPNDASSASGHSVLLMESDSQRTLSLEFSKFSGESDVNYLVEFSSDLLNWESGNDFSTEILLEEPAPGRQRVRIEDLNKDGSGLRFVRIRVSE
ncbi:MAG: thrombospondin type 3 repeat-containing protein [Verrucomicrobiaceae bacterium]